MATKPTPPVPPQDYGFSADFEDLSNFTAQPNPKHKAATVQPEPAKKTKPAISKTAPRKIATDKNQTNKPTGKKRGPKPKDSDTLAKSLGFSSRESQPVLLKKRRRVQHNEAVDQLSIRGPVRILNDFITFCDQQGCSYWEGIDLLLQNQKD